MFAFTYGIWLFTEVFMNRLMRSKQGDQKNSDGNSLLLIWLTIFVSIALAVVISVNSSWPLAESWIIPYSGLVLIWIGIVLRLGVIFTLGSFFTVDVTIRENHRLKTDGFYKYLRHPSYLASLISFVGFGISRNNWLSLLIVFVPVLLVFIMRIVIEERVLIKQFGTDYLQYKEKTYALFPFIY